MPDPRTIVPNYPTAARERTIDLAGWSRNPQSAGPSLPTMLIGATILGTVGAALMFAWPRSRAPAARAIPRSQETP